MILVKILYSAVFFFVASALLVFGLIGNSLNWFWAAFVLLLYLKGVLFLLFYLRRREKDCPRDVFHTNDFKMIALGWTIVSALFLVSAIRDEGVLGIIGAGVYAFLAFAFISRAKRNGAIDIGGKQKNQL
jgi:hypothetical protein